MGKAAMTTTKATTTTAAAPAPAPAASSSSAASPAAPAPAPAAKTPPVTVCVLEPPSSSARDLPPAARFDLMLRRGVTALVAVGGGAEEAGKLLLLLRFLDARRLRPLLEERERGGFCVVPSWHALYTQKKTPFELSSLVLFVSSKLPV